MTMMSELWNILEIVAQQMKRCAWLAKPRKKSGQTSAHHGQNDNVREYRDRPISWYDIQKRARSPATGQLADLRRFTRRKISQAIKQSKKKKEQIKNANCLINKPFKHYEKL